MTTDFDLISTVQPEEGWFCAVGIKGKSVVQKLVQTREELDDISAQFVAEKRNAFFAVARFKTDESRKKENVQMLKAFWLDIDCGPTKADIDEKTGRPKGYIDQVTGLSALKDFCKHIGLPKPILVNSGRGIHVYWELDREVTPAEWEPVASKLRKLCYTHELHVDTGVFETARVLRVPGTFNFKDDPPNPVTVMSVADPVNFDELKDILGVEDTPNLPPKRGLTALGQQFVESSSNSFKKIMLRSINGSGCQQLLSCYEDRETLAEPRWFSALSVAKFCKDKESAIHKLSADHPDYDPAAVEHKINHILGPHTCEEFEKHNPGGCDGCPFKGNIKSPIVLGREIEAATEEDNLIEIEEDGVKEVYQIPEYPHPFFRGKGGGIWLQSSEDEAEPKLVYEHDLYVLKRMTDPQEGDVVVMKLHTPKDGIKEFIVLNSQLIDSKEVKKMLAKQGVLCSSNKMFECLVWYVTASVRELQTREKAEQMRTQFGWADNNSKFIVGDREITAQGTYHSPPAPTLGAMVEKMQRVGTLEKWKEVFNIYGKQGLEGHAFATLSSFGSPLLKFAGQPGCLINLIHENSGTGKTTILHMLNSVWGHPKELCGMWNDTINAKFTRMGFMNNLPYTMDEITNTDAKDFSQIVYGMSQGRAKDRMPSNRNELRRNTTTWCNISVATSNASFNDKITALKASPDGELMRMIEYKIEYTSEDVIDMATAKYLFDHQLQENYGHAGDIYAEYIVQNLEYVKEQLRDVQAKIDFEFKISSKERFWSAAIAANITGGLLAKKLGLLDWDMQRIYRWAGATLLPQLREDVKTPVENSVAVLGDFINGHMQNILVVNEEVDARSQMAPLPMMEPRGDLIIRYEPDTKMMYIAARGFKEHCSKFQINYRATLKDLEKRGIHVDSVNKRLSKGMKITSPAVRTLVFDCSVADFLDIDSMLAIEEPAVVGGEG